MKLVLDIKSAEEMKFVQELLHKLQIDFFLEETAKKENIETTQNAISILEKIAQRDTFAKDITNAVEWQRELRKDYDFIP